MNRNILITGGAGFIGSHLADALLRRGDRIRVLDNLAAQVHGEGCSTPSDLHPDVDFRHGDVRDIETVRRALEGVDAVVHFAARVGVGQSMYEVADYVSTNNTGTAVLLQALLETPVASVLVASSMSIYGEGLYTDSLGNPVEGSMRHLDQLKDHDWELRDDQGRLLSPLPTPEHKKPSLASVYALSKYDQERMCLLIGQAYGIPTVALRFFNVYGTRQALSNPYTGVLAIFASRLLNNQPPLIFEDGLQQRDFVSVHDVVQACVLALDSPQASGHVLNIGSGQHYTVREVAQRLAHVMGKDSIQPEITGKCRMGDIRHCFADISLARRLLGYEPRVKLEDGLTSLAQWLRGQIAVDRIAEASAALTLRGLTL